MSMVPSPAQRQRVEVVDANPMLDTGRFDQIARVASQIAVSGMAPESITHYGPANARKEYDLEVVRARCFLIVEQAVRWNMPAFAVISACSLVHGKLCYEGKLVAAVLEAKLGVALDYEWDDKPGDQAGVRVFGTLPDGRVRDIRGTVADWKPSKGDSWGTPTKNRKMLGNRGTREWARLWAPGVLLGIYTNDELEDLQEAARDTRRGRLTPPTPSLPEQASAVIEHEAKPTDADLKSNTDAPSEEKPAEQQPAADQNTVKKTPPKPATTDAAPAAPRKAPPIPPANKAKAQPEEPKPEDADQTDWEAEVEAFDNACGSAESAEEIDEAKQAHEHLFALTTPKAISDRVDQIVAAELERIGRQG